MAGDRWVFHFEEGNAGQADLLGGKGAGLAEMTRIGLPVPPGFTITTAACLAYLGNDCQFPPKMWDQTVEAMHELSKKMKRNFGDNQDPLLVSVRSGSKFSMPGMMDTVLNLGLNDEAVVALAKRSGDERFAWDAYRRLVQMFGKVVMDVDGPLFEKEIQRIKNEEGVKTDPEVSVQGWKTTVDRLKDLIKRETK